MNTGPKPTAGVLCPECGHDESRIVECRPAHGLSDTGIYRRRLCSCCGYRYSTLEAALDTDSRQRAGKAADFARRVAALPEEQRLAIYRVLDAFDAAGTMAARIAEGRPIGTPSHPQEGHA